MKSLTIVEQAIRLANGNITIAALKLGISRNALNERITNHPALKVVVDECRDGMLDNVESSLYSQAMGVRDKKGNIKTPPTVAAGIFILKTQGRKRGWVERNDLIPAVTVAQFIGEFTTAAVSMLPPSTHAEAQLTFKRIVSAHFAKLGAR